MRSLVRGSRRLQHLSCHFEQQIPGEKFDSKQAGVWDVKLGQVADQLWAQF